MAQTKQVGRRGVNTPRPSKAPRAGPSPRARAIGGKRPPGGVIAPGRSARKGGRPQRVFHCIRSKVLTNRSQLEILYHPDDRTATSPAQSRYAKYGGINIPPIFYYYDFPSQDSSEKSPSLYFRGTLPMNFDFKAKPFRHYKKQPKLSLCICSKTPIFAPSTPSESLLCRRIFSWPGGLEELGVASGDYIESEAVGFGKGGLFWSISLGSHLLTKVLDTIDDMRFVPCEQCGWKKKRTPAGRLGTSISQENRSIGAEFLFSSQA